MWAYEKLLVLHHGVYDCSVSLIELCEEGNLSTVLNILLLGEFPNLSKVRGEEMRMKFLEGGGLALI